MSKYTRIDSTFNTGSYNPEESEDNELAKMGCLKNST